MLKVLRLAQSQRLTVSPSFAEIASMMRPNRIGSAMVTNARTIFAALIKSVVLVGQGNKFELWDREKWEQALERNAGFGDGELPPELEGFSL